MKEFPKSVYLYKIGITRNKHVQTNKFISATTKHLQLIRLLITALFGNIVRPLGVKSLAKILVICKITQRSRPTAKSIKKIGQEYLNRKVISLPG